MAALYNECGCDAGAFGLLGGLALLAALLLLRRLSLAPLNPLRLTLIMTVPLVAGVGGKLVGMVHGRRQLRQAVAELRESLDSRPAPGGPGS